MNAPKTKKSSEKTFNLLKEISPRIKIKESVIALGGRMNAARQIMSPIEKGQTQFLSSRLVIQIKRNPMEVRLKNAAQLL